MDTHNHRRRSIRLKGYDYTRSGAYFITICAYDKICLFGNILAVDETGLNEIILNDAAELFVKNGCARKKIRSEIRLDEFVIMPSRVISRLLMPWSVAAQRIAANFMCIVPVVGKLTPDGNSGHEVFSCRYFGFKELPLVVNQG